MGEGSVVTSQLENVEWMENNFINKVKGTAKLVVRVTERSLVRSSLPP